MSCSRTQAAPPTSPARSFSWTCPQQDHIRQLSSALQLAADSGSARSPHEGLFKVEVRAFSWSRQLAADSRAQATSTLPIRKTFRRRESSTPSAGLTSRLQRPSLPTFPQTRSVDTFQRSLTPSPGTTPVLPPNPHPAPNHPPERHDHEQQRPVSRHRVRRGPPRKAIINWTTYQLMLRLYHCKIMMPVNEARMWAMIALPIIKNAHERGTLDEAVAG